MAEIEIMENILGEIAKVEEKEIEGVVTFETGEVKVFENYDKAISGLYKMGYRF